MQNWLSLGTIATITNYFLMQELINNIVYSTGISTDKASEVLLTVSGFIKEKYPLLAGTVDSVLKISSDKNDEEN